MQSSKALTWQSELSGGKTACTGHESLHHAALPQVCQAPFACLSRVPLQLLRCICPCICCYMAAFHGWLGQLLTLAKRCWPGQCNSLSHALPTPAAASATLQLDTARTPL